MRFDSRYIPLIILGAASLVCGIALVGMLVAIAAPALGLGEKEGFLLFRMWGFSRSDTVSVSFLSIAVAFILALIAVLVASARAMPDVPAPSVGMDAVSRMTVPVLEAAARRAEAFLRRVGLAVVGAWAPLNQNWAVALFLSPFAAFVLGVSLMALPEGPWLTPDSGTYLSFSLQRTIGYPIFVRMIAMVSDDPRAIPVVQLCLGLGSVIFLAEALQRALRNCLVSLPTGIFLMFNWPMLEHALYILTDYPFFAFICLQFGATLLVISKPSPQKLAMVALTTAIAVTIRPAALFLIGVVPFLVLVHRASWRLISVWLLLPLAALLFAQAGVNKAVFDYFGLSRWTGYPMAANTMFILKDDTPSDHPQVVKLLYAAAKPYQKKYAAIASATDKTLYNISVNNLILADASNIVNAYGNDRGIVTTTEIARHESFVRFINNTSPLNRQFAQAGIGTAPNWVWFDSLLTRLAVSSVMHNSLGWAGLVWPNLQFSLNTIIPVADMPEKEFAPFARLRLDRSDLGFGATFPRLQTADPPVFTAWAFNRVGGLLRSLERIIPIPGVVLAMAGVALALFTAFVFWDEGMPPQIAGLAYLAGCLLIYHLEVDAASIPLPRLISPVIGAALPLLFSPILAFSYATHRKRRGGTDT